MFIKYFVVTCTTIILSSYTDRDPTISNVCLSEKSNSFICNSLSFQSYSETDISPKYSYSFEANQENSILNSAFIRLRFTNIIELTHNTSFHHNVTHKNITRSYLDRTFAYGSVSQQYYFIDRKYTSKGNRANLLVLWGQNLI